MILVLNTKDNSAHGLDCPGGPGGPPSFFDHQELDQRFKQPDQVQHGKEQTKFEVLDRCCIEVARYACMTLPKKTRVCLLVHGRERGPAAEQKYRQSKAVSAASTLEAACSKDKRPTPPKGGIYVEDVCLHNDRDEFDPALRLNMVYAAASKCEHLNEEYLNEMELKVRNVLRIMVLNKCSHIILGAWGCGPFLVGSTRQVASIFRRLLQEEMAGAFKHVTFAVQGPEHAEFKAEILPDAC
jgi:hypothetical protein